MTNRKPAKPSQQFTPVAEKDAIYKAIAKAEAKGKVRQREIEPELKRDKQAAGNDWSDSNKAFFDSLK